MTAFVSLEKTGLWVTNGARDVLLDWLAEHRCVENDARWNWCKSEQYRWSGCGVDLSDFQTKGIPLRVTKQELEQARKEYGQYVSDFIKNVDEMYDGSWTHQCGSVEARNWFKGNLT